ncbi:MAG: hypothetical protein ABH864_04810 [archaeon]
MTIYRTVGQVFAGFAKYTLLESMDVEAANHTAAEAARKDFVPMSDAEYAAKLRAPGVEAGLLRSVAQLPPLHGVRKVIVASAGSSNFVKVVNGSIGL